MQSTPPHRPRLRAPQMTFLNKIGKINNTAMNIPSQIISGVLRTVVEMLNDRGYQTVHACQSFDDIEQRMRDNQHIVQTVDAALPDIYVYFNTDERVGVKQLRNWIEVCEGANIIVISLDGPTAFTKREAETNYPNVQFFLYRDLCVNITRHMLVPKHVRMSKEEVETLEKRYRISDHKNEWPTIYTTDRVAQYYAFAPGDLIQITRHFSAAEPVYYYRLVRVGA